MSNQKVRHILGLSGGKDSSALAIFMRDKVADMEYIFLDTGKELPETYEYVARLEAFLGKQITRLNSERTFDHWLTVFNGVLPSPQMRWCTKMLKLVPFERYVGNDPVINYVAIRADEDRQGYISTKPNIKTVFPFKENNIRKDDVIQILSDSGLGLPDYYRWRTRSGCYFCFFQRKAEWVGLKREHPGLFELAKKYEKVNKETGQKYTWSQGETLEEIDARKDSILQQHTKALQRENVKAVNRRLLEVLEDILDDEDDDLPCLICHL